MTRETRNPTSLSAQVATSRHRLGCIFILCIAVNAQTSCSFFEPEERIPLIEDLRTYASQARARINRLSPRQRAAVEPALRAHERAIRRYDRLMAQGETRLRIQAPLVAAGAFILADDVTGFGVADDVALPFLALAAVAAALGTTAPASSKALKAAYREVVDTAEAVSKALESAPVDDSEINSMPGTRQWCIDLYVDCQQNGRRGFPARVVSLAWTNAWEATISGQTAKNVTMGPISAGCAVDRDRKSSGERDPSEQPGDHRVPS